MMNTVYELSTIVEIPEYEGFAWEDRLASVRGQPDATMDFTPEITSDGDRPVRLATLWRPTRVVGKVRPWNDFPCINFNIPAFSRRAVDALRDLLEPNGELLPLISDVGEYYAYNVTTVADVLDVARSEVTWGYDFLYISSIQQHEFLEERLRGRAIFWLPQMMLVYYVTQIFAQRVREHRLQGFDLAKVWPLPKGADWYRMKLQRLDLWKRKARNARRRKDPIRMPCRWSSGTTFEVLPVKISTPGAVPDRRIGRE
jgi:hypothetical protein